MRITYLSAATLPSPSAYSIHVMKMCQALAAHGHLVTLHGRRGTPDVANLHAHYGTAPIFDVVRLRHPPLGALAKLLYVLRVASRVRRARADLVYARHAYSLAACATFGSPLLLEVHEPPIDPLEARCVRRLVRSARLLCVVAVSDALRAEYERLFPGLDGRILVAHDAADALGPGTGRPAPLQSRSPGRTNVGYVGQLYRGKGVEMVVNLARRLPDMDFHVVGGAPRDLARWRSSPKPDNLTFHGFVAPGELPAWYAAFDLLVAPYEQRVEVDGRPRDVARWMSPLKLFEYMSAGRAIVCSDLPVLREILEPGVDAVLVPPGETDAWARALQRLAADPDARRALATRAHRKWQSTYTWHERARRILDEVARRRGVSAGSGTSP